MGTERPIEVDPAGPTPPPQTWANSVLDSAPSVLIGVGILLRAVFYLSQPPIWTDEAMLAVSFNRSPISWLHGLGAHQSAPFGFLVLSAMAVRGFGDGVLALRAISLLAGVGALFLLWILARRILPRPWALVALAVLALSSPAIYYSGEAKQYSTDLLVALALLLVVVPEPSSARHRNLAAIAGLAGVFFSQTASFVLAGASLWLWFRGTAHTRRLAILWAGTATAGVLIYSATLGAGTRAFMESYWADAFLPFPPGLPTLGRAVTGLVGDGLGVPLPWIASILVIWGLARARDNRVVLLILPILLAFVASFLHAYPFSPIRDSLRMGRLFMFAVPSLVILVAYGLRHAGQGGPLLALLLLSLIGARGIRTAFDSTQVFYRTDVTPAIGIIQTQPDTLVVAPALVPVFRYYWNREGLSVATIPEAEWVNGRSLTRAWVFADLHGRITKEEVLARYCGSGCTVTELDHQILLRIDHTIGSTWPFPLSAAGRSGHLSRSPFPGETDMAMESGLRRIQETPGTSGGSLEARHSPGTRILRPITLSAALLVVCGCAGNETPSVPSDPVEWLASQAIPLATVDPSNRDFSDLEPLHDVIGDSRVVLLGEESHGDGTVFLTKTRLIEFLHQELGFDVLAFESGLFDMRKAWEAMVRGDDPREAFSTGVFGIWAGSAEVQPLIAYLGEAAQSDRPLELAGFDSQFTGSGSRTSYIPDLEAFLNGRGSTLPSDPRWAGFRRTLAGLIDGSHYTEKPPEDEKARFREVLTELWTWVGEGGEADSGSERRFWSQLLKSTAAQAEGTWEMDMQNPTVESSRFRDEQMGDNLIWLANDWYRGRKIIVWAATFHNVRNIGQIDSRMPDLDYSGAMTMGHRVWQALGTDSYNLGFTAYEGEAASWRADPAHTLPVPAEGSLEDLMARAGLQNALVDFRGAGPALTWLSKPMIARPLGYAEMEADWTSIMDGIFFNRVMERSTPFQPSSRN